MGLGEFAVAISSGGVGFLLADGLDRFLATYSPLANEMPKDKFTSSGAGTLANTLNIADRPNLYRIGAAVGTTGAPAVASMFVKNKYAKAALEGMAVGAGVNAVKLLVANFIVPMLVGKDTTTPALQKSYIARLYPSEVAAAINRKAAQLAVSSAGSGALSGADAGPFALSGDSPYPDAAQALRGGLSGDSPYPDAAQALRGGLSGDSPYPSAQDALRHGVSAPYGHGNPGQPGLSAYEPGPPAGPGPGPQATPHKDSECGCMAGDQYAAFLGESDSSSEPLIMVPGFD